MNDIFSLEALLNNSIDSLLQSIAPFDSELFNRVPYKDSWTAGQVSEHVEKSINLITQMIEAATEPTKREPKMHVKALSDIMLDMHTKSKSAPELLPDNKPKLPSALSASLIQAKDSMIAKAKKLDLYETCVVGEFPGFGYLTRFELISFASFHTDRHAKQINNIYKQLI